MQSNKKINLLMGKLENNLNQRWNNMIDYHGENHDYTPLTKAYFDAILIEIERARKDLVVMYDGMV